MDSQCSVSPTTFYGEMTGLTDEGRAMDTNFDMYSNKILVEELIKYGLDKQTVKWKLSEWVGPEHDDQWRKV